MADYYVNDSTEYFASIPPEEKVKLANAILNKIEVYRNFIESRKLTDLWKRKTTNYYGLSESGNSSQLLTAGGSEGELSMMKVNDLNNAIKNQLVIVTGDRTAGIAKAINSDTKALRQSMEATALCEYYLVAKNMEKDLINATEYALVNDEYYVRLYFDEDAGEDVLLSEDGQSIIKSGDAKLMIHPPWYTARDVSALIDCQNWHIFSYKVNKFDLAMKYPDYAEQIKSGIIENLPDLGFDEINDGSDQIYVHELIHKKTPSVPNGRIVLLCGNFILRDSEELGIEVKEYHIAERIAPSDVMEGQFGYSSSNDIMAMEATTDALYSAISTNQLNFSVQNLLLAEGANLNHTDLAKGLRVFEINPALFDKIKPLELCKTPAEVFSYIAQLSAKKDMMVGINSITKGAPEGQLSGASGAAMALIQAQAISFNSGIQRNFYRLLSNIMSKLISILDENMKQEMRIEIVGRMSSYGMAPFSLKPGGLEKVSSIIYEPVDPISQTPGGKLAIADNLLEKQMIQSPKQYLTLVKTGQMDPMTQDSEMIQMTILEENELLMSGEMVDAVITENHQDHIRAHNSLLTPSVKKDQNLAKNIVEHIQMHINLWMQSSIENPAILMATGQNVLQPGMGLPMGPPPQQEGQQMEGPPTDSGSVDPQQIYDQSHEGKKVNLPNLPTIAGTDQKPNIPGVM